MDKKEVVKKVHALMNDKNNYTARIQAEKIVEEYAEAKAGQHETLVIGTVVEKHYKDGEPCELHCERHVTHPCERCGRTMACGEATVLEFE